MVRSNIPARVLVVEDHAVMREVICETVDRHPQCVLVGAVRTAEEALGRLQQDAVDLVLVDVSLPQMSGLELIREIRKRFPGRPCLIISGHMEVAYARLALAAGASGYVLKGRPDDLDAGISAALEGNIYLSIPLREQLQEANHGEAENEDEAVTDGASS
jgi:DNA-binding NarL/FixJ family response regulator